MHPAMLRRQEGRDQRSASPVLVIVLAIAAVMLFGHLVPDAWLGAERLRCGDQPSAAIPAHYLELYKKAGADYGVPWSLLAGIGKVETGHGTSWLRGVHDGENPAGAAGPMQFLRPTWKAFRVDGNNDHKKSRYDPADAIPAAARYLKRNGAPDRTRTAVYAYNHSGDYVDLVLHWADRYDHGDYATTGRAARRPPCH